MLRLWPRSSARLTTLVNKALVVAETVVATSEAIHHTWAVTVVIAVIHAITVVARIGVASGVAETVWITIVVGIAIVVRIAILTIGSVVGRVVTVGRVGPNPTRVIRVGWTIIHLVSIDLSIQATVETPVVILPALSLSLAGVEKQTGGRSKSSDQ